MFNALLISTGAIVGIVVAVVAVILVIALVGWYQYGQRPDPPEE